MKNTDIYAFSNFEFLAITFAQMTVQGREINMDAVTGNMDKRQREWFSGIRCGMFQDTVLQAPGAILMPFLMIKQNTADRFHTEQLTCERFQWSKQSLCRTRMHNLKNNLSMNMRDSG
ncbi:hypothetical protein QON05_003626 [Salmonella enterica]|nr:hypothetical protein [Salmonella enterica subsp. diarizonae]EGN5725589.1 hypothetical protein [Salmonella enterica]EDR5917469.1 hypothetical protein [Salmonella enterica subsp. diarizonae]EJJ8331008.1 hypothetical protein [Salmonella enterica]ELH5317068.1 hypothetical protein [Salmonella enterica]